MDMHQEDHRPSVLTQQRDLLLLRLRAVYKQPRYDIAKELLRKKPA
jgi:hypothetical protein